MMYLLINKDTVTEHKIELTSYFERPAAGQFSGTYVAQITNPESIPSYAGLTTDMEITSLELRTGGGALIPISGTYNALEDINMTYEDPTRVFRMTITLKHVA